ncbi:MAG: type II secretion system protein [Planctomycetota bacterium]
MYKQRGFTLIELLVVIAIIALLMSILMPALARARRQAREAICQNNLKQWGSAFSMYTGENDGYFVQGFTGGWRHQWQVALKPYYSDKKLLLCPMATKPLGRYGGDPSGGVFAPWRTGSWNNPDGHLYGSYGANTCIYHDPGRAGRDRGWSNDHWRRDDVKEAAIIPLLLDANWLTGYPWWKNDPPVYEGVRWRVIGGNGGDMGHFCLPRHSKMLNGLFVDYSVRNIGLKELWVLKWARTYQMDQARDPMNEPAWPSVGTGWLASYKDYVD